MCFPDTHRQDTADQLAEVIPLAVPPTLELVRELMAGYQPFPVLPETEDPEELQRREEDLHDYLQDAAARADAIHRLLGGSAASTAIAA